MGNRIGCVGSKVASRLVLVTQHGLDSSYVRHTATSTALIG